jgi:uncharacterized protein YqeY
MSLSKQITEEMTAALKAGDSLVLSTLRMLLSEIKNKEIDKKGVLTDEEVSEIIRHQVKTHKESITAFQAGKREDLVAKERDELAILNKYLPQQMTTQEIKKVVEGVIVKLQGTPTDFGKVMGEVMAQVKGKADGGQVSALVKELLAK